MLADGEHAMRDFECHTLRATAVTTDWVNSSLVPEDSARLLLLHAGARTPTSPVYSPAILAYEPENPAATTLQAPCLLIPNYAQDLAQIDSDASSILDTARRWQAAIANHSANLEIEKRSRVEDVERRLNEWERQLEEQSDAYEQRLANLEEREARLAVACNLHAEKELGMIETERALRKHFQGLLNEEVKRDVREQKRQRAYALRPRKNGKATRALKASLADADGL